MSKAFLDTNFLLDLAMEHRPHAEEAAELFGAVSEGKLIGYIAASSLKDFYYIARKDLDDTIRRKWIALFLDAFPLAEFSYGVCSSALASDEPNFEDGLVRAAAEDSKCDFIVSRDEQAFLNSPIRRATAQECLAAIS